MTTAARYYYDFVDPISFLVESELSTLERKGLPSVVWVPFELRPPPLSLTDPADPVWSARWDLAREHAAAKGFDLVVPHVVPWSRKAHELVCHARSGGGDHAASTMRRSVFEAFFVEGRDIGRVDVLVELAAGLGLERTETKAVLDVDRYAQLVREARNEALRAGVDEPSVLRARARILRGFHNGAALSTFLRGVP